MTYLLDTNTCIRYLNGRSDRIRHHLESTRSQDIRVCAVVKAELFYGSMKSQHPERNLTKQTRFLDRFMSLPFDDKAAIAYGEIRASLEKVGTPIGPNDLMIAAIAVANMVTLVSHNTREFFRISALDIIDWEI
jgi:tRNA(fMet)-specific endonuclease VapC